MESRLLSHYTLCAGHVYKMHCCIIDEQSVSIIPYEQETASTEFYNGIILIADITILNHINELQQIVATCNGMDSTAQAISTYINNTPQLSYTNQPQFATLSINAHKITPLQPQ